MGKAFYRKYRSKRLSEVIGQSHITDALQTALNNDSISHAYLFTGPRGVGKTSVARILAHEINSLPYQDDESTHLDIIEIDAASNRRIDEIRDLKDKVHIAPTSAKYKVYIIDEVHMLTKEAFNALLKTLEEPPAHVVFILATTEAHKLPETIISRTQRFTFKSVGQVAVVDHLASIAKQENIDINSDALEAIAEHGEGSFRDSISLLDQMRHSGKSITAEDVEQALGVAPKQLISQTIKAILQADRDKLEQSMQDITEKGVDIVQFAHQLAVAWRKQLIAQAEINNEDLLLLDELSKIGAHPNPSVAISLALYRPLTAQKPVISNPAKQEPKVEEDQSPPEEVEDSLPQTADFIDSPEPIITAEIIAPAASDAAGLGDWDKVLQALKKKHNTLYGLVRMASPVIDSKSVTLGFSFPFHVRRIAEDKNRRLIEDTINEALGRHLSVKAVKSENPPPKKTVSQPKAPEPDSLSSVSNIFGAAEIVES